MNAFTCMMRFFGLSRRRVEERLVDLLATEAVTADLTAQDEDVTLLLTASDKVELDKLAAQVADRMNVYLYSRDGKGLAARVVELLQQHGMTIAMAESCTGGMTAAALTEVPGCSSVFETGVVSYSGTCKEKLLRVRKETLKTHGAVSAETAGEMARGVRAVSGASLGISITGEAGPKAAEDHPVGTVYIALADGKRTWVHKHCFGEGRDRTAIRQAAAGHALDLARRYLEAYPTVMAGGVSMAPVPKRNSGDRLQFLDLFPRRGDSRKKSFLKIAVWALALLIMVGVVLSGYHLALAPDNNRQLQESLRGLYWDEPATLSDMAASVGEYPEGMMPRFRSLYEINPDIGGWIRIPDTVIDYPVMYYCDGYYKNHSFAHEYSSYGQPYFSTDGLSNHVVQPEILLINGNNTADEQMFSTLSSYRRIAYLRENPVIEMSTLYRAATWQVFAVLVVDARDTSFDYTQITEKTAYLDQLRDRSLFNCSLSVTGKEPLLLLSTNAEEEYGREGARLLIAAVEIADSRVEVAYEVNWNAVMPKTWTTAPTRTTAQLQADNKGDPPSPTATTVTTVTPTTGTVATSLTSTTATTQAMTETTATATGLPQENTTTSTTTVEEDRGEDNKTDQETETENDADLGN